ncbi:uncharacterized protein LOC128218522 [Mya arenaria]|nr:uncharacterized protein LOC128218522 [Mya arenaria]
MAANYSSSVYQTSDLIHDFACSPCKDDGLNNEAQFFCDECKKYYCNNCVLLHNKLFRTHTVLGKQDVSKWVGYARLNPIEACDKHGDKKLELLCEDHDELCCHICVSLTHRMCQSIKHIPDLVDGLKNQIDLIKLPADVQKINHRLQEITEKMTHNKESLKVSGKKLLAEIKTIRNRVNAKLDELEKMTNAILQHQLHEAECFLQDDIDKCTNLTYKLKSYLESIQSQQDDNNSYIAYKKCTDKMREAENLLKQLYAKPNKSLVFHEDPMIEQFLSGLNTLETLGKIFDENYVYKVKHRSQYTAKIKNDKKGCLISGICELPGGEILISDFNNYKVKLLDSQYQVIDTYNLPDAPLHICHIAGNEAAVTLGDKGVHFITVTGRTLSVTRKLTIPHYCHGISHHNGNLYMGSWTAIYQYTMSGQLVKKIYEDNSAFVTVGRFTVRRDGTNIPDPSHNKLITIDTSGNILSTLQDLDFDWPISVCVSDRGHVFVCSHRSHTVTLVDKEGKHKITTLVTMADGLCSPLAIWFSKQSCKLIVGREGDEISVLELE